MYVAGAGWSRCCQGCCHSCRQIVCCVVASRIDGRVAAGIWWLVGSGADTDRDDCDSPTGTRGGYGFDLECVGQASNTLSPWNPVRAFEG